MASRMEYEPDSPLSYDVEEGELSSGRSSPGTIRENASECSTKTDDCEPVTTMTVEVDKDHTHPPNQPAPLNQPTPLDRALRIAEHTVRPKTLDVRKILESFRTRTNRNNQVNQTNQADITELKNTKLSYQHNKPVNNHIHQHNERNNQKVSPSMPLHPPPVKPLPPVEEKTTNNNRMQQRVQQKWFERKSSHIRPNKLRFPYALTPRSNNIKSFFHQSTNKQSPTSTVSETIWFTEMDPRNLTHIARNITLYSHKENGLICHLNLKCTSF